MSEQTEEEYLIERLSKLLAEISVIVNGPQPMGVLWSYADLPQKVQALKDAAALNAQAGVVEALAKAKDAHWKFVQRHHAHDYLPLAVWELDDALFALINALAAVKERDRG